MVYSNRFRFAVPSCTHAHSGRTKQLLLAHVIVSLLPSLQIILARSSRRHPTGTSLRP